MAFFNDEGEIHFTPAELHALETEFFQFEEKIAHVDPESLRTELLASKWMSSSCVTFGFDDAAREEKLVRLTVVSGP